MLQVLGGTVNAGSGMLTVRCSAVADDSTVAKVARLVEQASRQNHLNCLDHFARVCEGRGLPCSVCQSLYLIVKAVDAASTQLCSLSACYVASCSKHQSSWQLRCVGVVGHGPTTQK